jgi:hypothetical protein
MKMSNFKEFVNEIKESSTHVLPESNITLPAIQLALKKEISGLLAPLSVSIDDHQKFVEEVSNLFQNEAFLSEYSQQIGEPKENESEDEFVNRSSDELRQMLYRKFGLKN